MASKANTFVASFVAAAALACIDVGSIQSQRLPDQVVQVLSDRRRDRRPQSRATMRG